MPLWHTGAKLAARNMPKIVNPTTHAVLDYAVAGAFLFAAARLWNRHRRAAVGSLLCGGAAAANAMFTDYPGGVFRVMSYRTHGRIDAVIAGLTASAPQLMGFSSEAEARFFSAQALSETVIAGLSDFHGEEEDGLEA